MRALILFCLLGLTLTVSAQQNAVRGRIDSERDGEQPTDEKMYEKAKKFIKLDSTYYVGFMLEGTFLFYRANDELGFRKAIVPFRKALDKIEHDFDRRLRTRSNNFQTYAGNYRLQYDYALICYYLNRCYQNVEAQDEAMDVMYHLRDRKLQFEFNVDAYNTMAWIYHRNRMYTSERFSFLKNSVQENVKMANKLLDSALMKVERDFPLNNGLYDPSMLNRQYLSTFHYKAMIYDYLLDIDSANYYYDVLIQNNAYSSNNYAEFKLAMGEFEEADRFFQEAEASGNGGEKSTKEYFYMRGTLGIYRGHPEQADTLLSTVLRDQGSTPGYGWHSIGLARAQHYEGLTAESQDHANKAARFQELHIGTTWGQEQYNMAVASLNYINQLQFKKEYFFENDQWYFWLNPVNWYRWIKYTLAIRHHKTVLASLIAENPEREQVIYSMFSPENLITFDEVWSVIEGFGNEYFIDVYKKRLASDKRPQVLKYFRYALGKLYLAEGNEEEAKKYFMLVLNDSFIDDPYHTMLRARTFEGLALASSGDERWNYTYQVYRLYPQLLPFSELNMQFQLNVETKSDEEQNIVDDLRNTQVDFNGNTSAPFVTLSFAKKGTAMDITFAVQSRDGVVQRGTFRVEEHEMDMAGKLLSYHLFGIQKTIIGDEPKPEPAPVDKKADPASDKKGYEKVA